MDAVEDLGFGWLRDAFLFYYCSGSVMRSERSDSLLNKQWSKWWNGKNGDRKRKGDGEWDGDLRLGNVMECRECGSRYAGLVWFIFSSFNYSRRSVLIFTPINNE